MTERQMLPGCPYAKKCGGCQLQNLSYPEQLKWKQAQVRRLLGKFHQVEPILGMENPYHYRNKVQAAFGVTRDRRIVSGIYQSQQPPHRAGGQLPRSRTARRMPLSSLFGSCFAALSSPLTTSGGSRAFFAMFW